jgi:hypothetical protein
MPFPFYVKPELFSKGFETMKRTLFYGTQLLQSHIIIFFTATVIILAFTTPEIGAETRHKTQDIPSIHTTKTFLIYAKEGNSKAFDPISGKLVKNEEVKDFRNGELLFIITGPNSAILSANTGISDVEVVRDNQAVTFIETTLSGNKHIMIIKDEWDAKGKGFKFTYTRNIEDKGLLQKTLRSVYSGAAKPAGQYQISKTIEGVGPSFRTTRTFIIYARKGNYTSFDLANGKLLDNEDVKDFRKGELQYTITGANSALFSGNAGSTEVELVKDDNSVTFIETTFSGNKHIMIIENKWDTKEKGFTFTYIRNTEDRILLGKLMRSIYSGIARPAGY